MTNGGRYGIIVGSWLLAYVSVFKKSASQKGLRGRVVGSRRGAFFHSLDIESVFFCVLKYTAEPFLGMLSAKERIKICKKNQAERSA